MSLTCPVCERAGTECTCACGINVLNIHKKWLMRLAALADNMYITLDKFEAKFYEEMAIQKGQKLVLSIPDLGIRGYEGSDKSSTLFYTQRSDRMVCTYGIDKQGLRDCISSELNSLWYIENHKIKCPR